MAEEVHIFVLCFALDLTAPTEMAVALLPTTSNCTLMPLSKRLSLC